jgi:hypothetical protein
MQKANELCRYYPSEFKIINRLMSSLGTLHVDMDPSLPQPVIYSIASSRFIEFRGHRTIYELNNYDVNNFLVFAGLQSPEGSLVDLLYNKYLLLTEHNRSRQHHLKSFYLFVLHYIDTNNIALLNPILATVVVGIAEDDIILLKTGIPSRLQVYNSSLIKSCLFNVIHESSDCTTFPSFSNMTRLGRNTNKHTFVSAVLQTTTIRPVGSSHRREKIIADEQQFGRPKYFFRFTFTTGYIYVLLSATSCYYYVLLLSTYYYLLL